MDEGKLGTYLRSPISASAVFAWVLSLVGLWLTMLSHHEAFKSLQTLLKWDSLEGGKVLLLDHTLEAGIAEGLAISLLRNAHVSEHSLDDVDVERHRSRPYCHQI
jgi:hypothetical protein